MLARDGVLPRSRIVRSPSQRERLVEHWWWCALGNPHRALRSSKLVKDSPMSGFEQHESARRTPHGRHSLRPLDRAGGHRGTPAGRTSGEEPARAREWRADGPMMNGLVAAVREQPEVIAAVSMSGYRFGLRRPCRELLPLLGGFGSSKGNQGQAPARRSPSGGGALGPRSRHAGPHDRAPRAGVSAHRHHLSGPDSRAESSRPRCRVAGEGRGDHLALEGEQRRDEAHQ